MINGLLWNLTQAGYEHHPHHVVKVSEIDKIAVHLGIGNQGMDFVRRHLRTVLQYHPTQALPRVSLSGSA